MGSRKRSKTPKSPVRRLTIGTGRPRTELTLRQLRQVEEAAACGLPQAMIARVALGVAESTWHEMKDRDSRISGAVYQGRAKGAIAVGRALLKCAKGGDMTAIRWYESTRLGMNAGGPSLEEEDERHERERMQAMPREEAIARLIALLNTAAARRNASAAED